MKSDEKSWHRARPGDMVAVSVDIHAPVRRDGVMGFDEVSYAAQRRVDWYASSPRAPATIMRRSKDVVDPVTSSRTALSRGIDRSFRREYRALAKALLFGDDAGLEAEVRDSFIRTGTAHILAVSGMHVSVLAMAAGVMVFPLTRAGLRSFLTLLAVVAFVLISGTEPSVVRAASTVAVWHHLRRRGRIPSALNVLCFITLVLLVLTPDIAASVSFRLSFAAVAGILMFEQRCSACITMLLPYPSGFVRIVRQSMAMTLAANVFVAPVVAWHMHSFTLISVVANIVSVPLSMAATLGIATGALAGMIWSDAAVLLARGSEVLMFLCIAWSDVLGSVPGVYFSTRDAIVPAVCISGLSLFAFAARAR
ncbi:MAG: ComEC/Rec2 family competence protein, partial [Candidatus Kapaibacterium sp.]